MKIPTLFLILLVFSCVNEGLENNVTTENKKEVIKNESTLFEVEQVEESKVLPEIHLMEKDPTVNFEISSCQGEECTYDKNLIFDKRIVNGKLELLLGGWHNCSYKNGIVKKISFKNDTLRLGTFNKEYQMTSDGFIITSSTSCMCYYMFNIEVEKINKIPNVIYLGYYRYKDIELNKKEIKLIKSELNK